MDLRRWLDARYDEGGQHMSFEERPASGGIGPKQWYVVVRASNATPRARGLWPAEREWLLQTWPTELRTLGPDAGLLTRESRPPNLAAVTQPAERTPTGAVC